MAEVCQQLLGATATVEFERVEAVGKRPCAHESIKGVHLGRKWVDTSPILQTTLAPTRDLSVHTMSKFPSISFPKWTFRVRAAPPLRPTDARHRRLGGEYLARTCPVFHVLKTTPLGSHH